MAPALQKSRGNALAGLTAIRRLAENGGAQAKTLDRADKLSIGFIALTWANGCGMMAGIKLQLFPHGNRCLNWRGRMSGFFRRIWFEDEGQDIAEYAVMLAVILVLVVGTVRLIGSNANNAFSSVASSIQ
jgi:Flp pilus assembly pilin Flp